ncbi:RNA-binding protein 41-like [Plodia interpunctella]|uniref:RNA-binding protein 41-like n=1 Tax=Plodia interpunctella TaxID=58824 RepID=UPI002368C411|nr:RNA-binding protein 41-like [Plodia interpunctella]
MSSQSLPKEFERSTEVLPIVTYGISTIEDLRRAEAEIHLLEKLKRAGLSSEEVKLYRENETGGIDKQTKVEAAVLKQRLEVIYEKISDYEKSLSQKQSDEEPSTSTSKDIFERLRDKPITIYPDPHHPMNNIKDIEKNLFSHLNADVTPLTKRRKELRRFERKEDKILSRDGHMEIPTVPIQTVNREGSLWDVKELQKIPKKEQVMPIIGPVEKKPVMYSIRNNKIVRLEPLPGDRVHIEEYRAVDIIAPVNNAERELLEGTKMAVDDIRKMERFKNYEPGIPSKVLYLKNVAPGVSREQLGLLFNQFTLANGGPVDVRLMAGRMRGQAFVSFSNEELAIQALEEINGTILSGRPVIAEFGRNNNTNREDAHMENMSDSSQDSNNDDDNHSVPNVG